MTLTKSPDHNLNYLASIVEVTDFRAHPNPAVNRLKIVTLFGNNIITSIDALPGLYVYFPVESALSQEFLSFTNSFREVGLNADPTKKGGFFEAHGRIKPLRLQQVASEGYIIPVEVLQHFCTSYLKKTLTISPDMVNQDFDTVCGHLICRKYVSRAMRQHVLSSRKTKGNVKRYASKLVEDQFRFHENTAHLKREVSKIQPTDYIAITLKLHGANFIVSNLLVKRKLSFRDRVAQKFGVKVQEVEYGMLYSSRAVIKNSQMHDDKEHNHFYKEDVWKIVADKAFPMLKPGISIVGEIVGYTPNGGMIQKGYDYGCPPNVLDFYVFKVTFTAPSGEVYVFGHRETVEFCQKYSLKMPETYYYGQAQDLFPDVVVDDHWHEQFLQRMIDSYLEKKCHLCSTDVWAEGVVLRKDSPHVWDAYKLKSFNFLLKESEMLDSGEVDLETQESVDLTDEK